MKQIFQKYTLRAILFLLPPMLMCCREVTVLNRTSQRIHITDFSVPVRTVLPAPEPYPNSMTIRVSGTISQPVTMHVDPLTPSQGGSYPIRRDTLAAGTYMDKSFQGDFYSTYQTELVVTGAPGTTGALTIEWFCQ
ncbi:hypothetical protein [Spirosoma fluviale]|uniref:Uncharacterized protein n=1 Tax=Spirosoma fluviale TaxID=1597977 RepID=A0A286FHT8_9BACT|nr:hypothetical protein [Spirosoma fluviale]SOD82795.1 hypothetical protein SAMN06269250_2260 [Spirosoma fluviale]